MKDRLDLLINSIKSKFKSDALGFILDCLCIFFVFTAIVSLPLCTYREQYTIITNLLCAFSSVCILGYIVFRGKLYFNFNILFIILYLLYAIIITLFTTKSYGYSRLWSTLTLFSFVFFLSQYWFNSKRFSFFIATICISLIIFLVFFVIKYRSNILALDFDERYGYDFGNVNTICSMFDIGILFMVYLAFNKKSYYYPLFIPASLMAFCALITGSRWGFITLVIGIIFLVYEIIGKRFKLLFTLSIVVLIGVSIGIFQLNFMAEYRKHFLSLFNFFKNPVANSSPSIRFSMFIDGIKLWSKNLIFGYGTDGFAANTSYGVFSHSSVVELLTNYGIIGFAIFYVPLFKTLLSCNYKSKYSSLLKIYVGFILVYSIFASLHVSKLGMITWSMFIGVDFAFNKEHEHYVSVSFLESKKIKLHFEYAEPIVEKPKYNLSHLKIAFVISSLTGGGAERVASLLANEWSSSGHEVEFFLTSYKSEKKYETLENIHIHNICKETDKLLIPSIKIDRLRSQIEEFKPDIIVSFLGMPTYYASSVAKMLSIPFVCSERNDPRKVRNIIYKFTRSISYARANHIVFQGDGALSYFSKSIQKKSSIILNPISATKNKRSTKRDVLITAGRLVEDKGFDILIDAFARFHPLHPEYELLIYGSGPDKDKLQLQINNRNLTNYVSLLPFTDNLFEKMSSSRIFVSSSRHEGMPNALCESLVLGIPCVATDCPIGLANQLIHDGKNGKVCKTNDPQSLFEAINEVVKNIDSYEVQAKLSISYYKKIFDVKTISHEWINIFENVLKSAQNDKIFG